MPYDNLTPNQKKLLDAASSVSTPPAGGVALEAYNVVTQYGQWFNPPATSTVTDVQWEQWFVAECAYLLILTVRPERAAIFAESRERSMVAAMESLSQAAINVSGLQGQTYDLQSIRYYVINQCIRRKPRVFPQVADIDANAQLVVSELWQRTFWNWRKRGVSATINTDETVTFTMPTAETFQALATRRFYFSDQQDSWCMWANADDMQRFKSTPNASTGRPQYFTMENRPAGIVWQFWPVPDQVYTVKVAAYIDTPATFTSATDTAPILCFPPAVRPYIREFVLGKVLKGYGVDVADLQRETLDRFALIAPQLDDRGIPEHEQTARDVYNDMDQLVGGANMGGYL